MQRALGMDMETPRSKSQQQIHSPSQPSKPPPQAVSQPQAPPQTQPQPQSQPPPEPKKQPIPQAVPQSKPPAPGAIPLPGMAKAPSQPDLSRSGPGFQSQPQRQDQTRSAGSSPSRQPPPPEQPFGKLFGFGASLLNQASNLMSVDPVQTAPPAQQPSSPKPPQKQAGPPGSSPGPASGSLAGAKPPAQTVPARQEVSTKPLVLCPLCKTELNMGDSSKTPNYNLCTQCHTQVCNMCGFNPMPHLTELKQQEQGKQQTLGCVFYSQSKTCLNLYGKPVNALQGDRRANIKGVVKLRTSFSHPMHMPLFTIRIQQEVPSQEVLEQEMMWMKEHLSQLGSPVVLCHNDLLCKNIIHNVKEGAVGLSLGYHHEKGHVRFIDYEYSSYNYQAFDIGNHFNEFAGELDWLQTYLQAYKLFTKKGEEVTQRELETLYVQVNKFALASHFFWGFWALIQAKYSTIEFDFLG
ncbi:hypothetical protein DNTS_026601 [Danionella cerebrum]|uniref:ethanolamine kinase n=1 Tax=Danionella cerebrum TaxID=2873325 RepID=A0A553MW54_9TELE|nr:hypothetical protein DNTS_026601 [Danionella translucida]